ncbi:MAG: 23S rRNA (guanosine(2251)-2'-O)-methyltransferase RlmB [Deltaproteobacteria bacterium]|nr:23S rRNA (guanosine(2251)-2'-O)-methyltransferase RlmB [Deltaproteobacteria bacterium]
MQVIYGINPVLETLRSKGGDVRKVILAEGRRGGDAAKILALAAARGVAAETLRREELDRLAGTVAHQGVLCLCGEFAYASLEEIVANRHPAFPGGLVLLLDGIEDPQNLGSLIRSAHCFGANGVIIPRDRAAAITPAVIKASAGAAGHVPVARVVNLTQAIDVLKEKGFWIYGTDAEADTGLESVRFGGDIGLVMGSEGKGLRPLVRKHCDILLSIPLFGKVDSLNVSVAAGILLHAIRRQSGPC